jgi:transposase
MVKLARQALQNGRVRKSDAIDTQAIARCLQQGQHLPARLPTGQSLLFTQWAGRYRALERERRHLQISLLRQVDQLWPGAFVNVKRFERAHPGLTPPVPLVQTRPLERKLVQAILSECPNPHDVRAFTVEEMVEFLRESVGRGGVKTARKVLRNAHQALLPPPEVAAIYAENVSADWARYQDCLARVETLQAQAETLVPQSPAAVLLTVPGVSAYHAARYLAAVGEAERFPSADHIWSYAGFDPIYAQSGDSSRLGKISRRGDPAFRDTLYLIGRSTAKHCPPVREAFQRCYRGQSRRQVLATIHAAHKANRLLYRLLIKQEPYIAQA